MTALALLFLASTTVVFFSCWLAAERDLTRLPARRLTLLYHGGPLDGLEIVVERKGHETYVLSIWEDAAYESPREWRGGEEVPMEYCCRVAREAWVQ